MLLRLALLLSLPGAAMAVETAYSTGVTASDVVKIDPQGNVYAAGKVQGLPPIGHNIAVVKLDPQGKAVFTSFLAGASVTVSALAVDGNGSVYIAGTVSGDDLTVTPGAYQTARKPGTCMREGFVTSTGTTPPTMSPCTDAFVTKFDPSGKLVFSTYFGGTGDDTGDGLAVDASGAVYLSGSSGSDDLPVRSAFQPARVATTCTLVLSAATYPCRDGFIAKLSSDGSALTYSTYLGGNGNDAALGIAVDAAGNVYAAGQGTVGFPVTPGVFADSCSGRRTGTFGFVAKLGLATNALVYSGCLGASDSPQPSSATAIALNAANEAYVAGYTEMADLATPGAFQTKPSGFHDAFALKISADGTRLLYSTYLGGAGDDTPLGLAVDAQGRAIVGGRTTSSDFPIRGAGLPACTGQGFVVILNADGSDAVVSGYTANDIAFAASADDTIAGASLLSGGSGYAVSKIMHVDELGGPVLPPYCIAGGADFIRYPPSITPGEVMTVFGRGLGPAESAVLQVDASGLASTNLFGTRVLVDGTAAALMYVQERQINFAAPYALAGKKTAAIQIEFDGKTSDSVSVPIYDLNPSIFRRFDTFFPLFIHEDGSLDSESNPAPGGSVVTFFTTGTGQTDPPSRDGEIALDPAQKVPGVTALILGQPAEVVYAGGIPGVITAVQEFQVRIPAQTPAGIARFQITLGSALFDIGNIWVRAK